MGWTPLGGEGGVGVVLIRETLPSDPLMARHHRRQKVHYLILRENKVLRSREGNGTLEYLEVTQKWGLGSFVLCGGWGERGGY